MRRWCLFSLMALTMKTLFAVPMLPEQVPPPLKPWVNWVLHDKQDWQCPFLFNNFQQKYCSWPTRLELNVNEEQGRFVMSWQNFQQDWVDLPGNKSFWPQNVTVNQKAATVTQKNQLPVIKLETGNHQITGEFMWDKLPEIIKIPNDIGLIDLTVNGQKMFYPSLKNGQLWLKSSIEKSKNQASNLDTLDIQVFRKISDEVPLQVETQLLLDISGQNREIKLDSPLLENFIPIRLNSPFPAKLENNGKLIMQVKPGRWTLTIISRAARLPERIPLNTNPKDWPKSEIWVFDARPKLRLVEINGVDIVDPTQTNLPPAWKNYPAYRIKSGETLVFKTIRRGDSEGEPNKLSLHRQLWLDFDGKGYTVHDRINGVFSRGSRLESKTELQLGRVSIDSINQLITRELGSEQQGIEIRRGNINLNADSRIVGDIDNISAVGWDQSFNHVNAEINLPPGWRLLAVTGVDNVPDSWLSRWTLFDLFIVLMISLTIAKLWSYTWGGVGLLTLILLWHEPDAPHFIWLNILIAIALLRVLPENKFKSFIRWYRNFSWLGLAVIAVPFIITQVRIALYPQLEKPWHNIQSLSSGKRYIAADKISAGAFEDEMVNLEHTSSIPRKLKVPQTSLQMASKNGANQASIALTSKTVNLNQVDPNALIQTGPGLPQWTWHKAQLSWNGSVNADQRLGLWFISPMLSKLLNILRVISIFVLALLLLEKVGQFASFRFKNLCLIVFLSLSLMPDQDVWADFPDKEILDELKAKLLEAPDCVPECAQISRMNLEVTESRVLIQLHVHAQRRVAVPLPSDNLQWFPHEVLVDGKPANSMASIEKYLWLNLDPGVHQVQMKGWVPQLSQFILPLPLKPHRVVVSSTDWQINGIDENGIADDQLQMIKIKQGYQLLDQKGWEPGTLPAFVKIERTLQLGLDWHIQTQIQRVSPLGSPIVVAFPLIEGESVTTPSVRVIDGKAIINMTVNQKFVNWQSNLKKTKQLRLTATDTEQWVEVWKADVSPVWHLSSTGLAMIHLNKNGFWTPEWRPWPGETVVFNISRPVPVEGNTLTIENSKLTVIPGKRSRQFTLDFQLNSSQGGHQTIKLPKKVNLDAVSIDGVSQPIRLVGQDLTLPMHPGKQQINLGWHQDQEMTVFLKTPELDLGRESVNTSLNIKLGNDRWVLFTWGPSFGPAVLFWGLLLVIIVIAYGMGKIPITPLSQGHWFLLFIGLSQIHIAAALVVISWFLLLGVRQTKHPDKRVYFNIVQVLLVILTLCSITLLFVAIAQGLLWSPEMHITGNHSTATNLNWYQDRSSRFLPTALVISVPLMVYKLLMMLWSFWLANAGIKWLKWGWQCFTQDGLWRSKEQASSIVSANGQRDQ